MRTFFEPAGGLSRAAVLGVALLAGVPDASMAATVEKPDVSGVWQSGDGDSRYAVDWCGPDGTQLCVTLTWIRPEKKNKRNTPYLNTMVVDHARLVKTSPMTWKGDINVFGFTLNGNIVMKTQDKFVAHGCAYVVVCADAVVKRLNEVPG